MSMFDRTALLLGEEGMRILARSRVAVFGLGGVGGHAAEALVRAGIGSIDLFDNDTISESNLNRQLFALRSTVGMNKTDAAAARLRDINPEAAITVNNIFYMPENADSVDLSRYDYVLDAIDTVTAKLELISRCDKLNVPIISCMGTGNKLDPTQFRVSDIYSTSVCPLARVMRSELKKRGIKQLKVVWSTEKPMEVVADASNGRHAPGSVSFCPPVAGMIMAGEVIKDLTEGNKNER